MLQVITDYGTVVEVICLRDIIQYTNEIGES